MPKISVIIPVYNVSDYLERCVNSVLRQTFKDFEIILVDDGSTDGSAKKCDEYAKVNNNIQVIHKKNGGLSDARNHGIRVAKGDYIAFIDSDDWVNERFLEEMYTNINEYDADISVVNFSMVYSNGKQNITDCKEGSFSGQDTLNMYFNGFMMICLEVAWNKLYKRSLFEDIRYPVGKLNEDAFTTYKLIDKSVRVYISKEVLYYYFQRPGSITHAKFSRSCLDKYDAFVERSRYFKEKNMHNLFKQNERERFNCIKELTAKVINSDWNRNEKRKWIHRVKKDIRVSCIKVIGWKTPKSMIIDLLFIICPAAYARLKK